MTNKTSMLREIVNELKESNPNVEQRCPPDFALLATRKETIFAKQVQDEDGSAILKFLVENVTNDVFHIPWEVIAKECAKSFGENNHAVDTVIYCYLHVLSKLHNDCMKDFLEKFFEAIVEGAEDEEEAPEQPQNLFGVTNVTASVMEAASAFRAPPEWANSVLDTMRQSQAYIPWIESPHLFLRKEVIKEVASMSVAMDCPLEMFPYTVIALDGNELLPKTHPGKSLDSLLDDILKFIRANHNGNVVLFVDNADFFSEAASGTLVMKLIIMARDYDINLVLGGKESHPDNMEDYMTNITLGGIDKEGFREIAQAMCEQAKYEHRVDASKFAIEMADKVFDEEGEPDVTTLQKVIDHACSSFINHKTALINVEISKLEDLPDAMAAYCKKVLGKTFKLTKTHLGDAFERSMIKTKKEAKVDSDKAIATLDETLKKVIFGQEEAITKIHHTLVRAKSGIRKRKGPLGVFLFLGASGTGKTFAAKKTQKAIYGDERIIRLDMSEFSDQTSVTKIFGSSAGYVGYDDGSPFLKEVMARPKSVVLIDEVEKAHPQVLNAFLHIFDEGYAKTSKGQYVDFKETVIFITGNVGSNQLQAVKKRTMAFVDQESDEDFEVSKKDAAMNAIKTQFRPEFLNRVSDIVIFNNLKKADIRNIISFEMNEIKIGCKAKDCKLTYDDAVIDLLVEKSTDPLHNGARLVSKTIKDQIETKLALGLLKEKPKKVTVKASEGNFLINFSK